MVPDALIRLSEALVALRLGLDLQGAERARSVRDDLVGPIGD